MQGIILKLGMTLLFASHIFGVEAQETNKSLYDELDLIKETYQMCEIVDRLEPGSHHYFSCLHYTEQIVISNQGLIQDIPKICSSTNVPYICYSKLSKDFFNNLLPQSVTLSSNTLLDRVSKALTHLNFFQLRESQKTHYRNLFNALLTSADISEAMKLSPMETAILTCSHASQVQIPELEKWEIEKACFSTAYELLELIYNQ